MIKLDMACFSKTRPKTQVVFVKEGHRLICSNDDAARCPAAGVAILIHRRWIISMKIKSCFHDRIMDIDFKIDQLLLELSLSTCRTSDTNGTYFQTIFNDITSLIEIFNYKIINSIFEFFVIALSNILIA